MSEEKILIGEKFCKSYIQKLGTKEVYFTQAREEIILTVDECEVLIEKLPKLLMSDQSKNEQVSTDKNKTTKCLNCKDLFVTDDEAVSRHHVLSQCMTLLKTNEYTVFKLEKENAEALLGEAQTKVANLEREKRILLEHVKDRPIIEAFQKEEFNEFKAAISFYKSIKDVVIDHFGEEETIMKL